MSKPADQKPEDGDAEADAAQAFDGGDQVTDLVHRVLDTGAVHHMRDGAVADFPIGRVLPMQQRIDHRVLVMRPPPPGDEGVRIARPTLLLQKRRRVFNQPALHIHDRPILVEHADLDAGLEFINDAHAGVPFNV